MIFVGLFEFLQNRTLESEPRNMMARVVNGRYVDMSICLCICFSVLLNLRKIHRVLCILVL